MLYIKTVYCKDKPILTKIRFVKETELNAVVKRYLTKKGLPKTPALTFDDVQILNRISDIYSRSDIKNLKVPLSQRVSLNIPIVSANMDTVTDSRMAIALARLGGLGFIHQFFSIEERVDEVLKVKRADNSIIENPATIRPSSTIKEAMEIMQKVQISSLLVVDQEEKLLGILTSRDLRFKTNTDFEVPIKEVMTAQPLITAHVGIKVEDAQKILEAKRLEKLPLVDEDGKVKGLITAKDILKKRKNADALRDQKGRLMVGATLRLNGDYLREASQLLEIGTDVLLLDTARGGSTRVGEATERIKLKFPDCTLVVGNIDTAEEVWYLAQKGADCLKVGIGPGAACRTQEETGVGLPQLYALATCSSVAKKMGVYIIADGGIKGGGHLAKALVAGADAVMIGGLFAGTEEAPGMKFTKGNQLWKVFRGSASFEHQLDRIQTGSLDAIRNPEGESGLIPYAGSVQTVIDSLLGGLRSSMSYVGAHDLEEFWKLGKFVWRTQAGRFEGQPRI